MAKADAATGWRAWLMAALVPAAAVVADDRSPPPPPPEPGLLEFLAEEPPADEELGEALLTRDLDRQLDRSRKDQKVKDDDMDPA